jgi:ribosomal protein S18 acetylase RimI-like enzyme
MQAFGFSTHVTVRAATANDAVSIAALLAELAQHEQTGAHYDAKALAEALQSTPVLLRGLLACLENKAVGVVLYYHGYDVSSQTYGFHLADMVVSKTYRRQGVARALVAALCHEAQMHSYAWISLTRLHSNVEAKACYDALGFHDVPVAFHAIGTQGMKKIVGN